MDNIVMGIDIGGSHITTALVDLQGHTIIDESLVRKAVHSKGTADEIVAEWTTAILDCKARHSQASKKIGIAMPGPFDYKKGISFIKGLDKYDALYNRNVKTLLAQSLHIDEQDIVLMNDAGCFLKGEVFSGAASGCNNVIGITLGTGLGSAIFKEGIVQEGDLFCKPYKNGTTEDYISTRWFINEYQKRSGRKPESVKELRAKAANDEIAASLFEEFGTSLGEILAEYIEQHAAEKVVAGGNIIKAWELFMPAVDTVLQNHHMETPVVKAALGEKAALIGACSLWT